MARIEQGPSEFEVCDFCGAVTPDAEFLPCTHVVCVQCFEEAVTNDSTTGCMVCDSVNLRSTQQDWPTKCHLCTDDNFAIAHCTICSLNLCEFCEQAHSHQDDDIISPNDHAYSTKKQKEISTVQLPTCDHICRDENGNFFCENCHMFICHECKDLKHTEHQIVSMNDMDIHCFEKLQNLLTKTKPLVSTLKESILTIENLQIEIEQRVAHVGDDISDLIDGHIAALHEHKLALLSELRSIGDHKINVLSDQLNCLCNTLEDIHKTCGLTSEVLSLETKLSNSVSAKLSLAHQLEELTNTRYEYKPQEDDYIRFVPNVSVGYKRRYNMFGVLDTQTPSHAHSIINEDSISEAKQRNTASLTVTVFDKEGARKLIGGDSVELKVQPLPHNSSQVKTEVIDNEDGSYKLLYVPQIAGEHRISVLLGGKHIKGSPIFMNVRMRKKHHGRFHCCTFCSTEGKMHIPCGCGATMPGSYSGCGHGHKGHPGCWHWSCCGNIEEKSDCL